MSDDYEKELDSEEEEEEEEEEEDDDVDLHRSSSKIKKHTTFDETRPTIDFQAVSSTAEPLTVIPASIPCVQFDGYDAVAKNFVEGLVDKSLEKAESLKIYDSEQEISDDTSSSAITFVEFFGSFTSWPTINEFTVELGEDRIGEYLSTWYYEEDWLYCVELKLKQSDGCCDYYIYETKWSLPTKEYPIPQATASIYFTIAVSRVKPPQCLVDVTYNYEGCRYVHIPFKHSFSEQWLFNIIEAKLKFFKTLRF